MLFSFILPSVILASESDAGTFETDNGKYKRYDDVDIVDGSHSSHHGEHAHAHPSHDKKGHKTHDKKDSKRALTQHRGRESFKKSGTTSNKFSGSHGKTLSHLAISVGVISANNMLAAGSVKEGAETTVEQFKTSEFVFGTLFGGLLGAHLGAMIPLAGLVGATGILGTMLTALPAIAGASIIGRLISESIVQSKDDEFSVSSVLESIDWLSMGAQIIGAAAGCAIGSLFFPAPILGSVIAGVFGGWIMGKIVEHFRSKSEEEHGTGHGDEDGDNEEHIGADEHDENEDGDDHSKPELISSIEDSFETLKDKIIKLKDKVRDAYWKFIDSREGKDQEKALKEYKSAKEELQAAMKADVSAVK